MFSVQALFPIAIGKNSLDGGITKEEQLFIDELGKQPNIMNAISTNGFVLNEKALIRIKDFVHGAILEYKKTVIDPETDFNVEITQSWFNWTCDNEAHHQHSHGNSYLSGVFYINAEEGDFITFVNPIKKHFDIPPKEFTSLNAGSWDFPVKTNDIVIFPSWLEHLVPIRTVMGEPRVSLAFNVYPKGHIGSDFNRTGLNV